MAQTNEQAAQKDLFAELEKNDVKVENSDATEMKENILKAGDGARYLGIGIHEVFIESVELFKANSGTLGVRFVVSNPDGKNDATYWLSPAALRYTIENISRLVVHNTAEDKKGDARTYMSNITSAKEVFNVAKQKLEGGVAFLSVRESKTQEYTDKNGEIKPSLEKNLLAYKPKEDAQQTVAATTGGTSVSKEETADLPF